MTPPSWHQRPCFGSQQQLEYVAALLLLLLAASSQVAMVTGQLDQIESRPVDGHQFQEGQSFRFVCKAVGNQDFAVRLNCPLAEAAAGKVGTTACFENCGRPLCDQPALNDCARTEPELLNTNCSRSVRQLSASVQEITVEYTFHSVGRRHDGSYVCQFKNMKSSMYIIVTATSTSTTTTSTPSTSTAAASTSTSATTVVTMTTATSSSSSSSASTSSSAAATSSSSTVGASAPASSSSSSSSSSASSTSTSRSSAVTSKVATDGDLLTLPPEVKSTATPTKRPDPDAATTDVPLKTGWFYGSIVGNLTGSDIILICLLTFILAAWLIGFLCIRCQVLAVLYRTRKPATTNSCCTAVLCLTGRGPQRQQPQQPHTNGGLRKFAEQERQRTAPLTAMSMASAASADALSSGQVYAEPASLLDGSPGYYMPEPDDHRLVLAGPGGGRGRGGSAEDYYRLQQEFDDPLLGGGGGTNPRSTFFPRDPTGRHSFQSARPAPRQRPGIPRELLLGEELPEEAASAAAAAATATPPVMTRDEFKRRVDLQRREIESLRQQLRHSQLQLSQQQQHQQPPQPQPQEQQEMSDYEFVSRVAAGNLPPSPPPPPPPPPHSQQPKLNSSSSSPTVRPPGASEDDADMLPPPPTPPPQIAEDGGDNNDDAFEAERRGSLGEAYRTGQRY